jgi:hypothetical protein
MPPAAGTEALLLAGLWRDVVDNVVRASSVPTDSSRHVVETESMPCSPRDVVVGTRAVTAHSDGTEHYTGTIVVYGI